MCHFLMYFSFDGKDKGSFYTYLPLEHAMTLPIFAKKVIHFYKRLPTYEKTSDCLRHFIYYVYDN